MSSGTAPARLGTAIADLRARLQEAEDTLEAIRSGAVDAIVVEGPKGRQVFTLQGAEHPYRVLAETMNEGAGSLAVDGTVLFCNCRLGEILGVPQGQLLGSRISDYVQPEQRGIFGLLLASAAAAPQRHEFECPTARGTASVLFSMSPIGPEAGEGICLVATDLTEQKKLERALEKFASQLSRSNEELSQFAYIASHDLQEPLRHIVGFGEMLLEHSAGMSAEAADCAARMQKAARRMAELIEALLQYSSPVGRERVVEPVDLAGVIAEVLLDLQEEVQQRQARITVEALPCVHAEALQMRRLLRNLLSNALKFQRAETPPEIKVASQPLAQGEWEISVQDNGIGFDAGNLTGVFYPFRRVNERRHPGSGMGLAICRRIVDGYGGTMRVDSEPGRGSTFYFTVPATARAEESNVPGYDSAAQRAESPF